MDETDFSQGEYDARLRRIRGAMARAGIDTLILSDPSNMAWATGYDGWSFHVHQAVVIPPKDKPVWKWPSRACPSTGWWPRSCIRARSAPSAIGAITRRSFP